MDSTLEVPLFVLGFFKADLSLEPYSTTFSDLFFRTVRLNRHIEVILCKSTRRWKIIST